MLFGRRKSNGARGRDGIEKKKDINPGLSRAEIFD